MAPEEFESYKEPDWLHRLIRDLPRDEDNKRLWRRFFCGLATAWFIACSLEPSWQWLLLTFTALGGIVFAGEFSRLFHSEDLLRCRASLHELWLVNRCKADAYSNEWTEARINELEREIDWWLIMLKKKPLRKGEATPLELRYATTLLRFIQEKHHSRSLQK